MKDYKEKLVEEAIEKYQIKKWNSKDRKGLSETLIDWYERTTETNAKYWLAVYIEAFMEEHNIKPLTA